MASQFFRWRLRFWLFGAWLLSRAVACCLARAGRVSWLGGAAVNLHVVNALTVLLIWQRILYLAWRWPVVCEERKDLCFHNVTHQELDAVFSHAPHV